ncbi:Ppx/GppA phosphatase family protein [Pelodictyon phaeoclathratiforme]|jgi:exopolyphosphatase/guanosine-5'-triphosphate,3'-diphosphate pyrophosphatase|uniref:Ppx/GppA phosphatase n=1 Tax=Pelodictyon phaeoclathratiforme (strain DSM 5477 / BU-1) TaxID=324925 RepID=B4SCZ3_PELPB|nr:Ppx/GppA phosphatase family protein [Pelodictyon phaeoclathratiforme]ACF42827.1 Ppx/GppA phosphatase [Pelodictyon phaeoclathratiforme BU-1]MBV5327968.1 Ppx/GppA family phosphatase [Chlorobium sp.]
MKHENLRVAAIDLGTNSFHMIIVEESPQKGIVEIDRVKDMICIGRGSISTKMLDEEAMQSGIAALKNFLVLASHHGVASENVIAFATSAIREAKNSGDFIRRVKEETGLKIKIISGKEEAEFIYYGVRNAVKIGNSSDLLFDIGGGSVEFVLVNQKGLQLLESRKIGVARMCERFVASEPIASHDIKMLEQYFTAEMVTAVEKASQLKVTRAIASSGTAQNIARMIQSMKGSQSETSLNNSTFTRTEFQALYQAILPLGAAERKKITGLDEKRVDLIVPGLILVDMIFRLFNLTEIVISDSALREGMVLHYLKHRLQSGTKRSSDDDLDIRRESVYELAFRCGWTRNHAEHVARLSLQLFDKLALLHHLDESYRELLEYASLLHNIGAFIAISSHHKHSQYIILNGELRGFSPLETEIIAHVARYHRKSPPTERHAAYSMLPSASKRAVDLLSGILRLANGLERGHRQNVQKINVQVTANTIILHLKTRFEPDIEIWAADLLKPWLEKLLNKSIILEAL